jgi:hypothetical protein
MRALLTLRIVFLSTTRDVECHVERHGSRRIVIVDRHVTHRRDTLQHFTAIC